MSSLFETLFEGKSEPREQVTVYEYDPLTDDGDISIASLPLSEIYQFGAQDGRMTFDQKDARRLGAGLSGGIGFAVALVLAWLIPGVAIASGDGFILSLVFAAVSAIAGYQLLYKLIAPKPNTLYRRVWELVHAEELAGLGPHCALEPTWDEATLAPNLFVGWQHTMAETQRGEPIRLTNELPVHIHPLDVEDFEREENEQMQGPLHLNQWVLPEECERYGGGANGWWYYRHLYPLPYTFLAGEPYRDSEFTPASGGLAVMLGTEDIYNTEMPFHPQGVRANYMWEVLQMRVDKALWGLSAGNTVNKIQTGMAVAVALGVLGFAGFMTLATAEPTPPQVVNAGVIGLGLW